MVPITGEPGPSLGAFWEGKADRIGLLLLSYDLRSNKSPQIRVEGGLQATEFVGEKGPLATLPRGVHLRRLFRGFFHAAFRHCAEQNSCSVLFRQNSFPQRLHLASTFFSILHSQRKKARRRSPGPNSCRFEIVVQICGIPVAKMGTQFKRMTDSFEAERDSYA